VKEKVNDIEEREEEEEREESKKNGEVRWKLREY